MGIISDTAKITECQYPEDVKIFRNASILKSNLGHGVTVGDDTTIERSDVGNFVSVNRRNYINDSSIGDYSYTGINTIINFAKIGKFCSIARNVDIGGADHDFNKFSMLPLFRFQQAVGGVKPISPEIKICEIGNDCWIAAGAIVLNKVKIGDGAIIGAGAVVTRDVPPYSMVVGVPARVVKKRFSDELIDELLKIKWWNWPDKVIIANIEWLINTDVNSDTIEKMKKITNSIEKR